MGRPMADAARADEGKSPTQGHATIIAGAGVNGRQVDFQVNRVSLEFSKRCIFNPVRAGTP